MLYINNLILCTEYHVKKQVLKVMPSFIQGIGGVLKGSITTSLYKNTSFMCMYVLTQCNARLYCFSEDTILVYFVHKKVLWNNSDLVTTKQDIHLFALKTFPICDFSCSTY